LPKAKKILFLRTQWYKFTVMTAKEEDLLQQLENRIRQLILQDKNLRDEVLALKEEVAEREGQIDELKRQNQEVAAQYANLKVARMLELSDSDTRSARLRLRHLVREVDKCIALINT